MDVVDGILFSCEDEGRKIQNLKNWGGGKIPMKELTIQDQWGGLFFKKTGERLPESIEDVDKIVAKCHGLKELPIVSCSIFPAVDMKSVDKEIDEFIRKRR